MSEYLTKLRQKPKSVRNNIALGAAGLMTLPILLFMLFGGYDPAPPFVVEAEKEEQVKPFATFWGEFKEQLASVQSGIGTSTESAVVQPEASYSPVVATSTESRGTTTTPSATTSLIERTPEAVLY
jgi:hypothetical protein